MPDSLDPGFTALPGRPSLRSDQPVGETYSETEYLLSGVADIYAGPATGPAAPTGLRTPYVTRMVVRRPSVDSAASGRVVVEPFNTSRGYDAGVVWNHTHELLQAQGDIWVGVTVRAATAAQLRGSKTGRYAQLDVPVNDVSWDVLGAVGRLVRAEDNPIGRPMDRVYIAGYSQSAVDIATFAMACAPRLRASGGGPVFDGYFPAARSASITPLQSGSTARPAFDFAAIRDADAPVVEVETQTDVEGFRATMRSGATYVNQGGAWVRRDDSDDPGDEFRLYEVAGAPHVAGSDECDGPASTFPVGAFLRAALHLLFRWVEHGEPPPSARRLELATYDEVSLAATDDLGNALGGVRSPFVDVALSRFEAHSGPGARCAIVGREITLARDLLVARYGGVQEYLHAFARGLDDTIAAGFLLPRDRDALLSMQVARAGEAFAQR